MPHIVIEYAATLEGRIDIEALIGASLDAATDSGVMKREDIKLRALAYRHFLLADGGADFVHTTVHLLEGRSVEAKAKLAELLRERQTAQLSAVHSVSIDIVDMNAGAYRKRLLDGSQQWGSW